MMCSALIDAAVCCACPAMTGGLAIMMCSALMDAAVCCACPAKTGGLAIMMCSVRLCAYACVRLCVHARLSLRTSSCRLTRRRHLRQGSRQEATRTSSASSKRQDSDELWRQGTRAAPRATAATRSSSPPLSLPFSLSLSHFLSLSCGLYSWLCSDHLRVGSGPVFILFSHL